MLNGQPVSLQGIGGQGTAEVSATSLSYGSQGVGTGETQSVTITNKGTVPLSITGVTIDQSQAHFSYSSSCNGPIASNGTCSIFFGFTPTTTGAISGRAIIENNGSTGPLTVNLSGQGEPGILVYPSTMTFPSTAVASSVTQTLNLQNQGTTNIALTVPTAASVQSNSPNEFSFVSTTCTTRLAPTASCGVTVRFTPVEGGAGRSGTLMINGSAVTLTGQGKQGVLSMQTSLDIGLGMVGQTISTALTVTNSGDNTLALGTPSILTNSVEFAIGSNTCTASLTVGSSCTITVLMTASTTGARTGTLGLNNQNVSLTGTGTPLVPNRIGDGISKVGACTAGAPGCATMTLTAANLAVANAGRNIYTTGAAGSSSQYSTALASVGKSTGKWYWEVTLLSRATGANAFPCLAAPNNVNLLKVPGYDGAGFGGNIYALSSTAAVGTVYSCMLDLDSANKTLAMWTNGVAAAQKVTVTGTLYPAVSLYGTQQFLMNFGQANFSYAVPSGFAAGVY